MTIGYSATGRTRSRADHGEEHERDVCASPHGTQGRKEIAPARDTARELFRRAHRQAGGAQHIASATR